jgi:hypothetical protein
VHNDDTGRLGDELRSPTFETSIMGKVWYSMIDSMCLRFCVPRWGR